MIKENYDIMIDLLFHSIHLLVDYKEDKIRFMINTDKAFRDIEKEKRIIYAIKESVLSIYNDYSLAKKIDDYLNQDDEEIEEINKVYYISVY